MSESPIKVSVCRYIIAIEKLTSVEDGHDGATEELTASGTKLQLHQGLVKWSLPKPCSDFVLRACPQSIQCNPV
jgi:hypothetical protein